MWGDNQLEWEELILDSFSTSTFYSRIPLVNHLFFNDRN